MKLTKIIPITKEESRYIQKTLGVSNTTVWHAVKYRRNNEIHRKIRKMLAERGFLPVVLVPEFDTIYIDNRVDADKTMTRYMVQFFENGATLEVSLRTGFAELRDKRGEVRNQWEDSKVKDISAMQEVAMKL